MPIVLPPQKIAIIGAECTGKTTLAKRFNTFWVGEYMRFYFDQQRVGFRSCLDDISPSLMVNQCQKIPSIYL